MWPPTSLPWGLFSGPKKKIFKRPYLKITFGTNMTFLQNPAEVMQKTKLMPSTELLTKGEQALNHAVSNSALTLKVERRLPSES